MSCNHCTTKFSFFHKEMGCANCGLSFCNKCIKQKCKLPSKGSEEYNVCRLCYTKLTAGTSSNIQHSNVSPPEIFLKRLDNLENSSHKQDAKAQSVHTNLSLEDQELVDRLEKLKEEKIKNPLPSDAEIRKRLASLKGENNYVETPLKQQFPPDARTDQQKVNSLLEQFSNERDIELAHNPQSEIEARLASLREQGVKPNEGPYISNLHDSSSSEEEVDRITKKIMDEVALDEKCFGTNLKKKNDGLDSDEGEKPSSPELPWCVLCNEDAKFKCYDCSGDLYCNDCNGEVHKNWGYTDHKVVPYKP